MIKRAKGVTISQVADAAGVARSSVSRAFTRPDMLLPETVERIMKVAEALGYVPNYTARALSTGRHGNIGLIVPDIANPFFPPLIQAAQLEADRSDFCIFLGNTEENPKQEDKLVGRFAGQVEGLVLASSRLSDERIRAHAGQMPLILINRDIDGIPRVLIDSGSGVRQAVEHLAKLGHRKIVYISGPSNSWSNKQRRTAIRSAAAGFEVTVETVPAVTASYNSGRTAVGAILATGATAAVAFDDLTAQGVLAGLAEKNVSVPGAFSLVGCDDVLGAVTYPALTSVSNRSTEAGRVAVSLLLEMMQSRAVRDVRYVLETHLVVRQSTGHS
ncbi:LacI family transcriptional regulator [Rhizobium sp. XQZ8]|uniref:LacI family DNA-binding transcriptional regulator n=1 Tax=Rhizobium populisoli TaxID=2859785 RepID=UPI001C668BB6|nr:LacI family DNA-binding transcriptional regulator [Rhizobium populisoli]MBW6424265.1 LacI family transcriptional regulator [Rhizobium populisoli]